MQKVAELSKELNFRGGSWGGSGGCNPPPPQMVRVVLSYADALIYSGTSELQTLRDHTEVSVIGRCPLYRECTR